MPTSHIITLGTPVASIGQGDPNERIIGTKTSGPRGIESVLEYNGLLMNVRDWQDTYLITSINGIDDADVRDDRQVNPGYHGETVGQSFYGGRTIVLQGKIITKTVWKLRDMQQALRTAFSELIEKPLFFRTNNVDSDQMIMCRKIGKIEMVDTQTTLNHYERTFQITLRASNPRFVGYTEFYKTALWGIANFITNPSAELDAATSTATRVADATMGSGSFAFETSSAATPTTTAFAGLVGLTTGATVVKAGDRVNARASVKIVSDSTPSFPEPSIQVEFFNSSAVSLGVQSVVSGAGEGKDPSNVVTPVIGTVYALSGYVASAPAGSAYARIRLRVGKTATSSTVVARWDKLMLSVGPTILNYFDGSMTGYRWTGTAHASASIPTTAFVYTLVNYGNFDAEPIIRIYGQAGSLTAGARAVEIVNETNGQGMFIKSLAGALTAIAADRYIEINIAKRQMNEYIASTGVLVGNAFNKLETASEWMVLEPGDNVVSVKFYDPLYTGAAASQFRWRNTFM